MKDFKSVNGFAPPGISKPFQSNSEYSIEGLFVSYKLDRT